MALISTPAITFPNVKAAERAYDELASSESDGWNYVIRIAKNGTAKIDAYDEDGVFVGSV